MTTEANVQALLRVEAANRGATLWRNNNGAARDATTGRLIRYGLGNDSKKLNDVWKSSDLIGITPILIQPQHVGTVFGVFTAVECKAPGWRGHARTEREVAQEAFMQNVRDLGGIATFEHEVDMVRYLQAIQQKAR